MVQFNFTYDPSVTLEQRVGFELAAAIWGTYLTDDVTINLHIGSSDSLGENGQAVGGAIPILHEQNYGVYQEYASADASSEHDDQALESLQTGNTTDFFVNGQVVDGNNDILLTSAQAKALGMDEALTLDNGTTWERDLVNPDALDGYILISNSFDWNYDYLRSEEQPEGTLDFLSMALHEIGHQLGFVSGLDGTIDFETLYSGDTQISNFTALDLFRSSVDSTQLENPDGSVSDLSLGQNSYFSIDGGQTNLGEFSTGADYQASHWKRLKDAMGIFDPTLAYQERLSIGYLDLQAIDVLGWDVDYSAVAAGLDVETLLQQAEQAVAADLGFESHQLTNSRGAGEDGDLYSLGYNQWWQLFEAHVAELGYSQWWQLFEQGYNEWQQYEDGLTEVGYSQWWQSFEAIIDDLGYSQWWQSFETDLQDLGYSQWWQLLEVGYSQWWQKLETFFSTLDKVDGHATERSSLIAGGGVGGHETEIFYGGENDDIIAGDRKQDRIKAGTGDDLIDGKEGHDVLWGEAGRDIIYGQAGNDLIYGGDDDDLLLGEAGDDDLQGEAGDDIASGGSGDDIVRGGEGKDDLKGGWGRDVLSGDAGDDRVEGEEGNDIVIGGEGQDQVNGGGGDDILYGDSYDGSETLQQFRKLLQQQLASSQSEETNESNVVLDGSDVVQIESTEFSWIGDYNDSLGKAYIDGAATGSVVFSGESGNYMVVAHYFDELTAGDSNLAFSLNGTEFNSFVLGDDDAVNHTRTIAQNLTLSAGDTLSIDARSDGPDNVLFQSLELISLDNLLVTPLDYATEPDSNQVTTTTSLINNTTHRVEAESMFLAGGYRLVEDTSFASGDGYIALDNQSQGKALTSFSGESGYYNIVVGYHDVVASRASKIVTLLDGVELDQWSLTQNLGTETTSTDNFLTRTVASGIYLSAGDVFELQGFLGKYNGTEKADVDYIDFVKVDAPQTLTSQSSTLPQTSPSIDSSLVAHWTFDETSGAVASDTTGVHNATIVNDSTNNNQWETGQLDGALRLDGVNDYVAVADSSDINLSIHGQRTVSIWFKADDTTVANRKQVIYEEGGGINGLNLYIHDGKLYAGGWNRGNNQSGWTGTYLQTDEIVSGQWHHVSVVLDGNEQVQAGAFSAYLDGELFGVGEGSQLWKHSGNIGLGAIDDNTRFHDGTSGATGSNALAGSIDDARIYNRALDKDEILTMVGRDNDRLQGGAGNDIIYGGGGDDTLYGESQGDTFSSLLKGAQTYNGHTYVLSEMGYWDDLQAKAEQLGGNLVTINNAQEEA
ncbi:MAG: NF038122 family metalloprotease, partial [Cyanobacteria bacterium J06632_3]